MIVYEIGDNKLQVNEPSIFRTEKDIQNLVENNIEEIFNIKFVASEYRIGEFRFDTVCYDQDTKSFVIIEYKKDHLNVPIKFNNSITIEADKKERLKEFLIEIDEKKKDYSIVKTTHQYDKVDLNKELKDVNLTIQFDSDNKTYSVVFSGSNNGRDFEINLNLEFMESVIIQNIIEIYKPIKATDHPPFVLYNNGESISVDSKHGLLEAVLEMAKKGIYIQRYKGLGEMNPEQLWETTMDPEVRVLLQVRADDLVSSEDLFTTLMGEEVDPRREFIQKNALQAKNLDV